MPLFGKSQKSPAEVVKALKEAVNALERGDKKVEKVRCLLNTRSASTMKYIPVFVGARGRQQESCAHKEHAVRHGRDGAAGGHRGGTVSAGVVQQQPVTSACAEPESYRL